MSVLRGATAVLRRGCTKSLVILKVADRTAFESGRCRCSCRSVRDGRKSFVFGFVVGAGLAAHEGRMDKKWGEVE
jgi:hypothetical protein